MTAPRVGRWFERYRQEWIDEMLQVYGYINREHLIRKFGISMPQASLDLARFQRARPAVVAYDVSLKRYVDVRPKRPIRRSR